jgi:hypothetical protein
MGWHYFSVARFLVETKFMVNMLSEKCVLADKGLLTFRGAKKEHHLGFSM